MELIIGFEFTVTVKLGFFLDTKGIREAVVRLSMHCNLLHLKAPDMCDVIVLFSI